MERMPIPDIVITILNNKNNSKVSNQTYTFPVQRLGMDLATSMIFVGVFPSLHNDYQADDTNVYRIRIVLPLMRQLQIWELPR